MSCRRIVLGPGSTVWTFHRAPASPPCTGCGGPGGTVACAFELSGAKAGQRCGKALCRTCAGGDGLCGPHRRLIASGAAAAAAGGRP